MDIFDDIIRCMKQEASRSGSLFVRKKDLAEFMGQGSAPVPAPVSVPVSRPVPQKTAPARQVRVPVEVPAESFQTTPPPSVSGMDMESVRKTAFACCGCRLAHTRTHVVFSDGSEHAPLMFIGEGPGADEDAQGVPFVGAAGQLLTKMITAMKYDRATQVYIANIVKCRPPGNRNPSDDEAAVCLPFLKRQIELVAPKAIVLLGAVPLKYLMKMSGITRLRGKWLDYNGIAVMPTYHPAYLLRNPAAKRDVWNDLQLVMAFLAGN